MAAPIVIKEINYGTRETPIKHKSIAALEKVWQIWQILNSAWLFEGLLSRKPHQEQVFNMNNLVWCFCVNYIPLNQVTRLIVFMIP
jgi:hypothetical protein